MRRDEVGGGFCKPVPGRAGFNLNTVAKLVKNRAEDLFRTWVQFPPAPPFLFFSFFTSSQSKNFLSVHEYACGSFFSFDFLKKENKRNGFGLSCGFFRADLLSLGQVHPGPVLLTYKNRTSNLRTLSRIKLLAQVESLSHAHGLHNLNAVSVARSEFPPAPLFHLGLFFFGQEDAVSSF